MKFANNNMGIAFAMIENAFFMMECFISIMGRPHFTVESSIKMIEIAIYMIEIVIYMMEIAKSMIEIAIYMMEIMLFSHNLEGFNLLIVTALLYFLSLCAEVRRPSNLMRK
jgi:hypothetical protein